MERISSLFTSGLSALAANWQKILLVIAVVWGFNAIMDIGERIGSLSTETKKNGEELVAIRGQLSDLKSVSDQMLEITKAQMELTRKLDSDYETWKTNNNAVTEQRVNDVSTGGFRLSIRKPVTTPAVHPVPYPAAAGH